MPKQGTSGAGDREGRLAAALRANLKRRKAAGREADASGTGRAEGRLEGAASPPHPPPGPAGETE